MYNRSESQTSIFEEDDEDSPVVLGKKLGDLRKEVNHFRKWLEKVLISDYSEIEEAKKTPTYQKFSSSVQSMRDVLQRCVFQNQLSIEDWKIMKKSNSNKDEKLIQYMAQTEKLKREISILRSDSRGRKTEGSLRGLISSLSANITTVDVLPQRRYKTVRRNFYVVLKDYVLTRYIHEETNSRPKSKRGVFFADNEMNVAEDIKQSIVLKYEKQILELVKKREKKNRRLSKASTSDEQHQLGKDLKDIDLKIGDMTNDYENLKEILLTDIRDVKKEYENTKKELEEKEKELEEYTNIVRSRLESFPNEGDIFFVYTDIQSSCLLWDRNFRVMADSMQVHNLCVRKVINEYAGYEVKNEGDAFLVCFEDVTHAINFCLKTQISLLNCKFPKQLSTFEETKEISVSVDTDGTKYIWRGLRIRMAIHCCNSDQLVINIDPVTQRAVYHGPAINVVESITQVSDGGEIMVSGDAWDLAQGRLEEIDLDFLLKERGETLLKGLNRSVFIRSIFPQCLSNRNLTLVHLEKVLKMMSERSVSDKLLQSRREKKQKANNVVLKKMKLLLEYCSEKILFNRKLIQFNNRFVDLAMKNPDAVDSQDLTKYRKELSVGQIELETAVRKTKLLLKSSVLKKIKVRKLKENLLRIRRDNEKFYEEHRINKKKFGTRSLKPRKTKGGKTSKGTESKEKKKRSTRRESVSKNFGNLEQNLDEIKNVFNMIAPRRGGLETLKKGSLVSRDFQRQLSFDELFLPINEENLRFPELTKNSSNLNS